MTASLLFTSIAFSSACGGYSCSPRRARSLEQLRAVVHAGEYGPAQEPSKDEPETPPNGAFELVKYPAELGENFAYVSPQRSDGTKRPALLYIVGGLDWGIGSWVWEDAPWDDDQSGSAFQRDEVVLMYPSLRGSHSNPGNNECMLGEVSDVISAAKYLMARPDVDRNRVYLAGHSSGATLGMLTLELFHGFRAAFLSGPCASVLEFGSHCKPADELQVSNNAENVLARSPIHFTEQLKTPVMTVEGTADESKAAKEYAQKLRPPHVVIAVPELDHWSVLAPASILFSDWILRDNGASPKFDFGAKEILNLASSGRPGRDLIGVQP